VKLLFVRYPPGGAGNFLISLLQIDPQVASWDPELQRSKGTAKFSCNYQSWFAQHFQPDLDNHLKYEPHHPYQLDFVSAKHPRGDELTRTEFVTNLQQRGDKEFLSNIDNNLFTVMRLNKPQIPVWGQEQICVNITVDTAAGSWFRKTRYLKLFGRERDHWISKENHPDFLKAKFKIVHFKNQYEFNMPRNKFYREFVAGEPAILPFYNIDALLAPPSNRSCDQMSIPLSHVLDVEKMIQHLQQIHAIMGLDSVDQGLVRWAHNHYCQTNVIPLLKSNIISS
jgi:hypothetical protein